MLSGLPRCRHRRGYPSPGKIALWTLAIAACAPGARAQSAGPYTPQFIGYPSGANASWATGVNQNGEVSGVYQSDASNPVYRAIYWSTSGGRVDLGTLPGGSQAWADGLNASSQVVGRAEAASGNWHAFLWNYSTGMKDLGVLPGGSYSEAWAINDLGQVVGYSDVASGEVHAFLWSSSKGMVDLGTMQGNEATEATGINYSGEVVGVTGSAGGTWHAFIWTASTGMTDLGVALPSLWSPSVGINNQGQVAGWTADAKSYTHVFLWSRSAGRSQQTFSYSSPAGLGVTYSPAIGINDQGQVAGAAQDASGAIHRFVWSEATGAIGVGNVPPASVSGPVVVGINRSGQVTGYGQNGKYSSGFVAYPFACTLPVTPITSGTTVTGTVSIPAALSIASTVKLAGTGSVTVPASVTIPAGKTSAGFTAKILSAAANSMQSVSAQYNGWTINQPLTVLPVARVSMASSIISGYMGSGTVTLSGPAIVPTTVALSSSNSALTVPQAVKIPQGASSAQFYIYTNPKVTANTPVTIAAGVGSASQSASITVLALSVASVTPVTSTVSSRQYARLTVKLTQPAISPAYKVVVTGTTGLQTIQLAVPAGQTSGVISFRLPSVTATTQMTITVTSYYNTSSASTTITVAP